ncbi:hypothetical protein M2152_002781 [Microbacteriaceae bacterium SG_E_30_P1]|uniref:DUF2383 domain-containing protein n=1 Tax=Antiquaquibacter oligotrophicus TaxID=2880260 RepID=A0ABT6KRW3_9MICO|nr:hypothetical protein [Antiquaquibacter oligotrophicus]MDH6182599.1 hypothetical protein [Antiquaquibacter oligotrophicus]UDF14436.1 hypothetical protein LH407_06130 [Antiquaquibacter oligotrophicus]
MSISKKHRAILEQLKHDGQGDTEHYAQLEALATQAGNLAAGPGRDDAAAHELEKKFSDLAAKHRS